MFHFRTTALIGITAIAFAAMAPIQSCSLSSVESTLPPSKPKVILIIGDGMDDHQLTIARHYLVGSNGRVELDRLPYRGTIQIQSVDENNRKPLYVSDSANTATSMATGAITSPSRIATASGTDKRLVTIMELAQASGLSTGIVTTSSLTDATPASFITHINQRYCQGPSEMLHSLPMGELVFPVDCTQHLKTNGGGGSIAEQLVSSSVDVLLGGGAKYFDQFSEGSTDKTVIDDAQANGYQIIRDRSQLLSVEGQKKLLGLFTLGTMPVRMHGAGGMKALRVEKQDGKINLPEPYSCETNPASVYTPSLKEMTNLALQRLDETRGFILMIESASIDKQSHVRRPCGSIGEVAQLNDAVKVAVEYAALHPETLILVTADHSQAAQLVSPEGHFLPLNFASPGYFSRLKTPEGGIMGINYATNDSPIMEYHTGAQIPLFAYGPSVGSLPAFMQQTEIFGVMTEHLELEPTKNLVVAAKEID